MGANRLTSLLGQEKTKRRKRGVAVEAGYYGGDVAEPGSSPLMDVVFTQ